MTLQFGADDMRDLAVIVERPGYRVGERVIAEILSGEASGNVYVDVVGQGVTHFTEVLSLEEHRATLDFDVTSSMRGPLEIRVWTARGEVRRTSALVLVTDGDGLSVELRPDRRRYRPGQPATIRVATQEGGQPVAASVGLDIVDEAVFAVGTNMVGLAQAHFQIEAELLQPRVWLYGFSPRSLYEPRDLGDDYYPHCTMRYAYLDTPSTFDDGWYDLVERIEQRQLEHARRNAWLLLFFLLTTPVALGLWVFAGGARQGKPLHHVGYGIGGFAAMGLVALTMGMVVSLQESSPGDGLIYIAAGLVVAGLVGTALARRRHDDDVYWTGISLMVILHLALVLVGTIWLSDFFELSVFTDNTAILVSAACVIPVAMAYVVADCVVQRRLGLAVAPIGVGAFYLVLASQIAVHEGWLLGIVFWFVGAMTFAWFIAGRERELPFREHLRNGIAGLGGTVVVSVLLSLFMSGVFCLLPDNLFLAVIVSWFLIPIIISSVLVAVRDREWALLGIGAGLVGFVGLLLLDGALFDFEVVTDYADPLFFIHAAMMIFVAFLYLGGRYLRRKRYGVASSFLLGASMVGLPLLGTSFALVFSDLFDDSWDEVQHVNVRSAVQMEVPESEEFLATEEIEEQGAGGEEEGIALREFFPETLFSDIVITGDDGMAVVELTMADSITNWKLDATAVSSSGAIGSATGDAIVFQPFFIEPQLPVSLTQGDTVVVPLSVFNYSDEALDLMIELEGEGWFEADRSQARVHLGPGQVDRVEFRVTAAQNGTHELTWTARGEGVESGESFGDAVRRRVRVEPYGRRRSEVQSGRLDGDVMMSVEVSRHAVEGSEIAVVEFSPGVMGQIVEGMDALLAMPTGCFEQTSSTLYPNAMALAYMERTKTVNPEIQMRAERFIAQGYQRILGFEVGRGGYSLFGGPPASHSITAYGLRMLGDVHQVYAVDPKVKRGMFDFVVRAQQGIGSWPVDSDASYVVGIDEQFGLTAFIAWSLATYKPEDQAVRKAIEYLMGELDVEEAATRDLALVLNLLVTASREPALQQKIAQELADRAHTVDGVVSWSQTASAGGHQRDRRTMEDSAFATLALILSGRHPRVAQGGLAYLAESKSQRGWGTTQATVAALHALTAAPDQGETVQEGTLEVVRDGESVWSVELDQYTSGEAHIASFDLPTGTTNIVIKAPRESGFQYRLESRFHEPWEQESGEPDNLGIQVEFDRTELTVDDRVEVRVTLEAQGNAVGMALVDVGIPPGFNVDRGSLSEAVERGEIADFEVSGRQVTLYLEHLQQPRETSFEIIAIQPVEASSGASSVCDYYEPERKVRAAPVDFVVR